LIVAHTQFAIDIGVQIESQVLTPWGQGKAPSAVPMLLSERELRSGNARDGRALPNLSSTHTAPETGKKTRKEPDLVIVHGDKYIVIEVEKTAPRSVPMMTYKTKLLAYETNPNIVAVWYICASDGIANRVKSAGKEVLADRKRFPLRVHTASQIGPMWQITTFTEGSLWMQDLGRLVGADR
jgi:hypothetical protein